MNITKDEAARALSEIAQAEGRSHALFGYRIAGPIFVVWGVIWVICYAAMAVVPPQKWGLVWLPADIIGFAATIAIAGRGKRQAAINGDRGFGWRLLGSVALIMMFSAGLFLMVHPTDRNIYLAFPALLTGTIYAAVGLWIWMRFLWVGMAVIGFTLIGFFFFPAYLAYWLAATGGGGLIVGGLLVRRA
ncbi:MAG TPA: hypothetical protein VG839_05310 [Asticcacaulis sp.]|nr:hypothetical protein [Asticcacaulis sp.]